MRKISIEVRGLCEDYAAEFSDNVSSIGHVKSTHPVRVQCTMQCDPDESLIYSHLSHHITICYHMRILSIALYDNVSH